MTWSEIEGELERLHAAGCTESRRPAPAEMSGIFSRIGLTGPFWDPQPDQWRRG